MEKENTATRYIGKAVRRVDALAKALGTAKYTSDMRTPDMLWGKAVFTKYAHARILSIDVSEAEKLPGVEAVITEKDLPGARRYGIFGADKPVLAWNKIHYQGDPVAFIAAVDKKTAEAAAKLVKVELELLPAIDDPREALKPDSIRIHEDHPVSGNSNILAEVTLDRGDVDEAFKNADIIIENDYSTPMIEHAYLEQDCCIAKWDEPSGVLELTAPQQAVYSSLRALAPVFNLPENRIRVICPYVGGGFGGKEDSCLDLEVIAGTLALKTGKTVYAEFSPEECFMYTGKRHGTYIHHRLAADKDGRILGLDIDFILDKGAYISMSGLTGGPHAVAQRVVMYSAGPYSVANARVHSAAVFTNHPYAAAFRGFGAPQAHFAMESQMDALARKLGKDPVELRRLNMVREGYPTVFGQELKEENGLGLPEALEKVSRDLYSDYEPPKPLRPSQKRGRAIASYMYGIGMPFRSEGSMAMVHCFRDGSVQISMTSTEMGQGINTALSQIVAETLQVDLEKVNICLPDTFIAPDSGPTVASRSTTFTGNALMDACRTINENFTKAVAAEFGCSPEEIVHKDGRFTGPDGRSVDFRGAIGMAAINKTPQSAVGCWFPKVAYFNEKGGVPMHTYSFGAHGIDLLVDTDTGEIEILRSILACDVGRAINRYNVEGQMEGGAMMGMGYALMEEVTYKNGVVSNPSLKDFVIPGFKDMPQMTSHIVEAANCYGPYGAKGVGEPPLVAAAAAVHNALADALDGLEINSIPFTPERVVQAIRARG